MRLLILSQQKIEGRSAKPRKPPRIRSRETFEFKGQLWAFSMRPHDSKQQIQEQRREKRSHENPFAKQRLFHTTRDSDFPLQPKAKRAALAECFLAVFAINYLAGPNSWSSGRAQLPAHCVDICTKRALACVIALNTPVSILLRCVRIRRREFQGWADCTGSPKGDSLDDDHSHGFQHNGSRTNKVNNSLRSCVKRRPRVRPRDCLYGSREHCADAFQQQAEADSAASRLCVGWFVSRLRSSEDA